MSDETVVNDGTAERVGFCQDCGKPLTRESVRSVGSRVFCEPCLTTRVSSGTAYGATAAPPPPFTGVPPVDAAAAGAVPPFQEPFPPMSDNPSPVLAGLLGLIPGVGAMYNGQYAKGIAHIVIYVVLQSLANHNGVLGLLVAGFVFYQVFEAYHTAKARREGRPLPDPFGLNNIGAQVGVHFRGTAAGMPPNPGQPTSYPGWTGYVPPPPAPGPGAPPPPPVGAWGSVSGAPPVEPYTQAAPPVWDTPAWTPPVAGAAPVGQDWASAPGVYPAGPAVVVPPVRSSNVPAAAVVLIGLGVIFMLINFLPEWRLDLSKIFPFVLMAFAGWLFYRRMAATGGVAPVEGEGDAYLPRAVCMLRVPVILLTVGVLFALQAFDVFRWGQTWPVLVIVVGVLMLLERSVGSRVVPVAPVVGQSPDANRDGKGL